MALSRTQTDPPPEDDHLLGAAEEGRRMRKLRLLVDLTALVLRDRPLSPADAEIVVEHVRERVLQLFPDKGDAFDLIYRPRFRRLIEERFGAGKSDEGRMTSDEQER
jgi:hypothetical protein